MTRITTGFDEHSTALEVVEGVDLDGRHVIVTGAASGIGVETARALAAAGATVTLAVRDVEAGRRAAEDVAATTGSTSVSVAELDVADLASVDAFCRSWEHPLHVLVNNAGVMDTPRPARRRLGAADGDQPPRSLRPRDRAARRPAS